jgi:hypothetical protein
LAAAAPSRSIDRAARADTVLVAASSINQGSAMSVEADFGITDWVFQANGTQVSWDISWPGVLDDGRFAAVSFQGYFVNSRLTRVSESFLSDNHENPHVGEVVRSDAEFGSAFRFSVVVIPSH